MKIVQVSTVLDAPSENIWKTVLKYSTLRRVMKGLIHFSGAMPEDLKTGDQFRVRLWFFHFIPAWKHLLTVSMVDEERHQIYTEERGGLVRKWNHLIEVSALPDGRTRYVDRIEIEAGVLTSVVAAWAKFQYTYRQRRWKALAAEAGQAV